MTPYVTRRMPVGFRVRQRAPQAVRKAGFTPTQRSLACPPGMANLPPPRGASRTFEQPISRLEPAGKPPLGAQDEVLDIIAQPPWEPGPVYTGSRACLAAPVHCC